MIINAGLKIYKGKKLVKVIKSINIRGDKMGDNRRWKSVYINTQTSTMLNRAEKFKSLLQDRCIKFETGATGDGVVFSVYCNDEETETINNLLDLFVFYDCFYNKGV